jgi:hypothetical protein
MVALDECHYTIGDAVDKYALLDFCFAVDYTSLDSTGWCEIRRFGGAEGGGSV